MVLKSLNRNYKMETKHYDACLKVLLKRSLHDRAARWFTESIFLIPGLIEANKSGVLTEHLQYAKCSPWLKTSSSLFVKAHDETVSIHDETENFTELVDDWLDNKLLNLHWCWDIKLLRIELDCIERYEIMYPKYSNNVLKHTK